MKRVTGIGGVFFKCKEPEKVKEWYNKHLGLEAGPYGANFEWRYADTPSQKGCTAWNTFTEHAKMFEPSAKEFMINYRVENITALVEQLKAEGVMVLDEIETYPYGKFVHIMDMEGNKIQLWEPLEE
jgi:predicted enzyme related to lactoylglutathione lyase